MIETMSWFAPLCRTSPCDETCCNRIELYNILQSKIVFTSSSKFHPLFPLRSIINARSPKIQKGHTSMINYCYRKICCCLQELGIV